MFQHLDDRARDLRDVGGFVGDGAAVVDGCAAAAHVPAHEAEFCILSERVCVRVWDSGAARIREGAREGARTQWPIEPCAHAQRGPGQACRLFGAEVRDGLLLHQRWG